MQLSLAVSFVAAALAAAAAAAPAGPGAESLRFESCKLDRATLPVRPTPTRTRARPPRAAPPANARAAAFPAPSKPTPLRVVLGFGTQNYTCADATAGTAPAAFGAKAALYDVSCLAARFPAVLATVPPTVYDVGTTSPAILAAVFARLGASAGLQVGVHYFNAALKPVFQFADGGRVVAARTDGVPAPAGARQGANGAVDWLRLAAIDGSVGPVGEVFRVVTQGGKAPPTCAGQPRVFAVKYAAEYCECLGAGCV